MTWPKPEKRAPRPRRAIKRTKRPRKVRKTSLAALKRRLWALFSAYVKERDGNVCISCGAGNLAGQNWHAGHLVSIRKASTAYDPENVHSQCGPCNVWKRGSIASYTLRFLDTYGEPKFRALMARADRHHSWKPHEIEELIAALERGGHHYETFYAERYGCQPAFTTVAT